MKPVQTTSPQAIESGPKAVFGRLSEKFRYATRGLWYTARTQWIVPIQLACAVLALVLSVALKLDTLEFVIIVIVIGMVMAAEVLNTAIEGMVDLVSSASHPKAKAAKDAAAGAVLLTAACAAIVGILLFGRHLLSLLSS